MKETATVEPSVLVLAKGFTPDPGGVEAYSDSVSQAWAALGYGVDVITQFHEEVGTEVRGSVRVKNVGPGTQVGVFWRMLTAALRQRRISKPALIHATTWRVAIPALIAFPGQRIAVTIHGREVTEMSGFLRLLMKWVLSRTDRALVISKSTLSQCLPMLPNLEAKSVISWNGLSYLEEAKSSAKVWGGEHQARFQFYSLCRLVPRKNIAGALRALARVYEEGYTDWVYRIAGAGEDRAALEKLATDLGLQEKVEFLGRIPQRDIGMRYRDADVFLHPQTAGPDGRDIEGFGLVIVDAMAFGVPVIAGRDGAPPEYIEHGSNGYLVDGSDIRSMADLFVHVMNNRDELRAVGEQGREWALATLTWTDHVKRLERAFALDQSAPRALDNN